MKKLIRLLILLVIFYTPTLYAKTNYYYSIDIGSDLELSDPFSPGFMDPGDIYLAPNIVTAIKNDQDIFSTIDPPPPPAVPIGLGTPMDYEYFFDLDGEDQLEEMWTSELHDAPIPAVAAVISCLWKEPDLLYLSFDDDDAPGWPGYDVPIFVLPRHGTSTLIDEIMTATTWRVWGSLTGAVDEAALGLIPDPDVMETEDDDVDALDLEQCTFWYWSCDHEACGDGQGTVLDPGAIYVSIQPGIGYATAFPQSYLGLTNFPGTNPTNEDADVDAFEFCTTDDADILSQFTGTIPGNEYLAIVFSVDQDDPLTANIDESGGLKPNALYISLLTGDPPVELAEFGDIAFDDIDALAFYDDGESVPETCAKWSQPPDCDMGVDIASYLWTPDPLMIFLAAEDWLCDGRPIDGIRWWGSYIGWQETNSMAADPPANRPTAFKISWYKDVPAGVETNYSYPGFEYHSVTSVLADYNRTNLGPGVVMEQYYCTTLQEFISTNTWEHEYEYKFYFPDGEEWNEKEGNIYWLSIAAVFTNDLQPPEEPFWGWKTTQPEWHWNDDAAMLIYPNPWTNMVYPPPDWPTHPYTGMPVALAFELLTEICPQRCKKWEQAPDMITGQDMQSWATNGSIGILRADDFISDGRPITDIHWWGSYLGWEDSDYGSDTNPIPPPSTLPNQPLGFDLSWHMHDEANCLPGTLITNIFVELTNCHEMYYGSVEQFWEGGTYEHEYQYYVDLLSISTNGPWLETNGVHYWLNIQAVFETNFVPGNPHFGWGWKISDPVDTKLCFSAVTTNGGISWTNDTVQTDGGIAHPRALEHFDLAFELTTTNIPLSGTYSAFTNMMLTNVTQGIYLWSTGHCGCGKQVLQSTPDLMTNINAWTDITTNALPRPENLWHDTTITNQQFYRIKHVN